LISWVEVSSFEIMGWNFCKSVS